MSAATGPDQTLDTARDEIRASGAATDPHSCRRRAEVALDAALCVMLDQAGAENQRRTAFAFVQHAHRLGAHSATLPKIGPRGDDSDQG